VVGVGRDEGPIARRARAADEARIAQPLAVLSRPGVSGLNAPLDAHAFDQRARIRHARCAGIVVKRFLTVDEAAKFLRINRKTLYDRVAQAEPPRALRIILTIPISRDGLLSWAGC